MFVQVRKRERERDSIRENNCAPIQIELMCAESRSLPPSQNEQWSRFPDARQTGFRIAQYTQGEGRATSITYSQSSPILH